MSGAPVPRDARDDARPAPDAARPRRRRRLAVNAAYNLLGQGAPLLVAYFAIPVLTRELGPARFGLLTLAWAVLGYFSLFDLGLGRALTQAVADRLATGRDDDVPPLVWTGLALMLALGAAGALAAATLAPWLAARGLNLPPELRREALAALLVLALAIPVVIVSAAIRGVLEAAQRFDLVNAVRVPHGIFSFAGPVIVLPLSRSLAAVVGVLVLGRLVATVAWYLLMLRELPAVRAGRRVERAAAGPLLRFGSWMTVSNAISPLLVTLDRFVIGAAASVAAVAYYTAPWEAITKLWLVPTALGAVLFPAFADARAADPGRARALYLRGVKATTLALVPPVVLAIGFAPEALDAWLGPDYARESATVLRWLAAGVLVNSAAAVPFALVQGSGRPDITAKLHMAELPAYVALMWWLVITHGIVGAAVAWTARVTVDALALFAYAQRLAPVRPRALRPGGLVLGAAAAIALVLGMSTQPPWPKGALAVVLLAAWVGLAWAVALAPADRAQLRALLAAARTGGRVAVGGASR